MTKKEMLKSALLLFSCMYFIFALYTEGFSLINVSMLSLLVFTIVVNIWMHSSYRKKVKKEQVTQNEKLLKKQKAKD